MSRDEEHLLYVLQRIKEVLELIKEILEKRKIFIEAYKRKEKHKAGLQQNENSSPNFPIIQQEESFFWEDENGKCLICNGTGLTMALLEDDGDIIYETVLCRCQ